MKGSSKPKRLSCAAFVLAVLGSSDYAFANQPTTAPASASGEHDAIFRSGLDQYAHGNNVGAITTWESLLGTLGEERGFKVLYNLGLAYQAIGDITHAIDRYGAFVKQVSLRQDVPRELAERAADAQGRLEQLQHTHGAIHVHAPSRGGLVLTRIGTSEPRVAGYVVWLAPGPHDIELFVGTSHVKRIRIDVVEGKTTDIETSPAENAEDPNATSSLPPSRTEHERRPLEDEPPQRSSTWIWIGIGATAVSFALPVTFSVVASNKKDTALALGPGASTYSDARSSFNSWRTASYVSYALPATLAIATALYVVLRPSSKARATTIGVTTNGAVLSGIF